jgi:hypothetical protein
MSLINATEGTDTSNADGQQVQNQNVEGRPDWLPEKFWVEDKANWENLAKSYGELETKFRSKEDDLKSKLIDELAAEAYNNRPESADLYAIPEVEGIQIEEVANHPLTKWWSEFSYENGFDQETFQTGIQTYIDSKMAEMPNYEVEMGKLGENAKVRTEAIGMWVSKNFNPEEQKSLERICTTAEGVATVEKMMSMIRGDSTAVIDSAPSDTTEQDVKKMMQDRRYWHPADRDPTYIAKVESFFKKKYG